MDIPRPRRKADPVTLVAVVLFVAVVGFELMLASWLPRHLRTERIWGRELAVQEAIDKLDWLRAHIRSGKYPDRWQRGEVELAMSCLDDIARHIREHQETMTREQMRRLIGDLAFYEAAFLLWRDGGDAKRKWQGERHLVIEQLDTAPWLGRQRERLAAALPPGATP